MSADNLLQMIFWTMGHILTNPDIHKSLQREVNKAFEGQKGHTPIQDSSLKQLPAIKRCVLEAIRLHAPGMITRKVVKTHTINVSFMLPLMFSVMLEEQSYLISRQQNMHIIIIIMNLAENCCIYDR